MHSLIKHPKDAMSNDSKNMCFVALPFSILLIPFAFNFLSSELQLALQQVTEVQQKEYCSVEYFHGREKEQPASWPHCLHQGSHPSFYKLPEGRSSFSFDLTYEKKES